MNKQDGFTLHELLIVIVLFVLAVGGTALAIATFRALWNIGTYMVTP